MEIRKDYILDRYVFYASERKKRPHEFIKKEFSEKRGVCYFCRGNEHLTPKEIGRIGKKNWLMRWFPNKFPAVSPRSRAYGFHEVIVETPNDRKQMWDLPISHLKLILNVYKNRIEELSKKKRIKYVLIFKNHGREAGTSLIHSHTQVTALPLVPSLVKEEVAASKKFKKCPYCSIVKKEDKSKRACFANKHFLAFAPYASRFNFEIWIFPKKHKRDITEMAEDELNSLAIIFKKVLLRLKRLNVSYNFFLHYSPKGNDLHFHIEITPRIASWGGFELGSNFTINSVLPEDAARFYRS